MVHKNIQRKVEITLSILQKMYPDPETELHYSTPFQLVMSVLMSAQTTDKQVNKVTAPLYTTIKWPQDILDMWQDKLTQAIAWVNYYKTKAKNLYTTAQFLTDPEQQQIIIDSLTLESAKQVVSDYGYALPDTISWLTQLAWVGEKTAKVVWSILFGIAAVAVDTHVHRVSNRIWLTRTKTPSITSSRLEKILPDSVKAEAHHWLILFGRYHCLARSPKCQTCPLQEICNFYQKTHKTS